MKITILSAMVLLALSLIACNKPSESTSEVPKIESNIQQTTNDMKSYVSSFEIPATDISRAIQFYQAILDIKIEEFDMPGMQMGVFPSAGQMTVGILVKGEGYQPSADGVTIYLNGGNNLQFILDKVEKNGGEIMVPKTPHGDESGYFAMFLDSEGNKIGLHSPN